MTVTTMKMMDGLITTKTTATTTEVTITMNSADPSGSGMKCVASVS